MTQIRRKRKYVKGLKKNGMSVSRSENKLADKLKEKKLPYERQKRIGKYIVDFFIPPIMVIEILGHHHSIFLQSTRDIKKRQYLEEQGLRIYEFSSKDVYNSPGKYAEVIYNEYMKLIEQKSI